MTKKQKNVLYRIIIAAVLVVVIALLPLESLLVNRLHLSETVASLCKGFLFLIPYFIIGYDILRKALKGILKRQVFDENFLMAVATIGAMILGEYTEGVAVMLFYQIGELFQSYAVGKSRRNIGELMDLRPDEAFVEEEGQIVSVDPDEVEIGTIITVRPGERIPIDGIVKDGLSTLDVAALTGESVPRSVREGDAVQSGSINLQGVLHIETTCEFGDSTASRILDLMENAGANKARTENFISRFAHVYTPAVCCSALAVAVAVPLIRMLLGMSADWGTWVYRALTFLVISCPCAVVISIPLTFFAAIGGASNQGILVKGSNYLEMLSKAKTIVMDKTGTLTRGTFDVVSVEPAEGFTKEELVALAAHAEKYSTHPIAQSILRCYVLDLEDGRIGASEELSGKGVITQVDGSSIAVGNGRLMETLNLRVQDTAQVGTQAHVAKDGVYAGSIVIADEIKSTSAKAVTDMQAAGANVVMLTGDAKKVAQAVASELGIREVHAELLPQDKVAYVEKAISPGSDVVVFVGDGINDAPVLMRADIGIAMGGVGSDAAIEAADIVLMDDDPAKIALAMKISARTMRIVYENIIFAIGVKLLCLLLSVLGIGNMWLAIFADVGVMVIAVLNAIRALRVPKNTQGV